MDILIEKLLSIGGNEVKLPILDTKEEILKLLKKGRNYNTSNLKVYKKDMIPNQCHRNSCVLYNRKSTLKLISGYALNNNIWYCHSWLFNGKNIIETTLPFIKYFGYKLKGEELNEFIFDNN